MPLQQLFLFYDSQPKTALTEIKSLKISKQPLPSFDWSPDFPGLYAAVGFDKMIHVGFVAKVK